MAQLLAVPQDGGDGGGEDPLAEIKADIKTARGRALFVETVAAGWGEGRGAAPMSDWKPQRLGPNPPASLAAIQKQSFEHVLAAAGTPPSLFTDADGTSQRESMRRFFLGTVQPLARMLQTELRAKLAPGISLEFDLYNVDLAGRASSFKAMVTGGMEPGKAAALSGLMEDVA